MRINDPLVPRHKTQDLPADRHYPAHARTWERVMYIPLDFAKPRGEVYAGSEFAMRRSEQTGRGRGPGLPANINPKRVSVTF